MQYYEDPILGKGRVGDNAEKMTSAARLASVLPVGKLVYDTDTGIVYCGDGTTLGGKPISNAELEPRIDALETAVGIIEEGGEVTQGGFFCGDWTDENTSAIIFGAWSASLS